MTTVQSQKNGPLKVTGPVVIEDAEGKREEFKKGEDAWLCRCGQSKNKPFCDGTHGKIGFKAEK